MGDLRAAILACIAGVNGDPVGPASEQADNDIADTIIALFAEHHAPSNLDRLAAWADEHGESITIERDHTEVCEPWVITPPGALERAFEDTAQAAAGAVLARLASEQTDG